MEDVVRVVAPARARRPRSDRVVPSVSEMRLLDARVGRAVTQVDPVSVGIAEATAVNEQFLRAGSARDDTDPIAYHLRARALEQ